MILDDPTSSLDNKVTATIIDSIMNDSKWSTKTFIIATRKMQILDRFDKIIYMENGSIKFFAPYSELKRLPEFLHYEKDQRLKEEQQQMENEQPIQEDDLKSSRPRSPNSIRRKQPSRRESLELHGVEEKVILSSLRHSVNHFEELNITLHSQASNNVNNQNAGEIERNTNKKGKK